MDFGTDTIRGEDKSVTGLAWKYHTETGWNLADLEEDDSIIPGESANYVWVVGQGGPNSGKVAVEEQVTGANGYENVGIYMKRIDRPEVKTLGTTSVGSGGVRPIAKAEIKKAVNSRSKFVASIGTDVPPFYGVDYELGDVIRLDADKGSLQVVNRKQRIYEVTLAHSDNNMEAASVVLSNDVHNKIVEE
jgi:hypothetical protein